MSYLDPNKISIVHWFDDTEKHRCGYCKNDKSTISNGKLRLCFFSKILISSIYSSYVGGNFNCERLSKSNR